ncbi:hypothetical protein DPMN_093699 [Dreissena polymorpha]|uniref:Uncharacterized protein n=1 Tax=Dreissena polymorpha TaxID=45954 RepID=A0A9D4R2T4_DREPO|nr:hypothetical protein DPMN_093699 [Dreissena polymorpha]
MQFHCNKIQILQLILPVPDPAVSLLPDPDPSVSLLPVTYRAVSLLPDPDPAI